MFKIDSQNSSFPTLFIDRPDVKNALNQELIQILTEEFLKLDSDKNVRAIFFSGTGNTFCAGADLNMMKAAITQSSDETRQESRHLWTLLSRIQNCKKPVVAIVNGPALGGGVGLAAACDIVLAHAQSFFMLSEARLGLAPSVISPFVIEKIGLQQARRYFLTAEKISTGTALAIGLVHEVYDNKNFVEKIDFLKKRFSEASPHALLEIKKLIEANRTLQGESLINFTTEQIANLRKHPEAQEGISAFFEKRTANYCLK